MHAIGGAEDANLPMDDRCRPGGVEMIAIEMSQTNRPNIRQRNTGADQPPPR